MLLAIDGGNSKTDLVVLDESGRLLARLAGSGSGNGPAHVASVVHSLLEGWRRSSGTQAPITACVAALAGLDFAEDAERYERALAVVIAGARIVAVGDARAVLDTLGRHGVAVVYGAGFNAVAAGPLGVAAHPALGWATGEWGGGHDLGREAVRIAYRSADGRGPRSSVQQAVLAAIGASDEVAMARVIRNGALDADGVGRLSRVLVEEAERGDAEAGAALERAVGEIRDLVRVLCGRAFPSVPPATPAVLAGGVFAAPFFTARVRAALAELGLAAERFAGAPVLGVARDVCRLAGIDPDSAPGVRDLIDAADDGADAQAEGRSGT